MSDDTDWSGRTEAARAALEPLAFLLGSWEGEGLSHGEVVRGRLEVRAVLEGTFLEARERLYDAEGRLDHEDLAFYHLDVRDGRLRVSHLMAPAFTTERVVFALEGEPGVRWFGGPYAPVVRIRPEGREVLVTVHQPFTAEAQTTLRYRPVAAGGEPEGPGKR